MPVSLQCFSSPSHRTKITDITKNSSTSSPDLRIEPEASCSIVVLATAIPTRQSLQPVNPFSIEIFSEKTHYQLPVIKVHFILYAPNWFSLSEKWKILKIFAIQFDMLCDICFIVIRHYININITCLTGGRQRDFWVWKAVFLGVSENHQTPPAKGGAEGSIRLLLTKNPTFSWARQQISIIRL